MAIIQHHQVSNQAYVDSENKRLKSILSSLVEKAEQNEAKQKKFQQLEFGLLNTCALPLLLDKLTVELRQELEVENISLHLYDPYASIQELMREIYPNHTCENVLFIDQSIELENLYEFGYKSQLRQKNYFLSRQLFPSSNKIQSFALLPLCRGGMLIGSLHLGSESIERFSPEMSTDFLNHFAQIIAICVENTVNTDRLKHLSLIDPLTKTKNRRCLYQALNKEVARAEREMHQLSCLFIDLDHFKQINDKFGHSVGDSTLKHIARVIAPNLRTTDLLARFGGEEFIAVLPNCDEMVASNIAERIRTMIENQTLLTEDRQHYKVTCSIGGTSWDPVRQHGNRKEIKDALIKCADDAVYLAKSEGRNRCCWKHFNTQHY